MTDTTTLKDSGDSTYTYIGEYFMFTEGLNVGVERRVASYVPTTGVVAMGQDFSSNIVSGDDYELHAHLAPSEWNRCINSALRRLQRRREDVIAIVDDQLQYSLAALTDLTRERQILEVGLQDGDVGKKRRRELHKNVNWNTWEDDDVLTLSLWEGQISNTATNLEIYIAYLASYASLSTDASTTTADFDLIVTGTLLQAMEWYPHRLEEPAKAVLMMDIKDMRKSFRDQALKQAQKRSTMIGVRF